MLRNKHVIRSSFVGLFIAILGAILFYRYFTVKSIVAEEIIRENDKIYSHFMNKICKNSDCYKLLSQNEDLYELLTSDKFRKFAQQTLTFFGEQSKIKLSIFSANNIEVISSSSMVFSKKTKKTDIDVIDILNDIFFGVLTEEDLNAKLSSGIPVHNILNYPMISSEPHKVAFVESYYPIHQNAAKKIGRYGTLKIVSDITDSWDKIKFFETRVSCFLFLVFSAFFAIIVFNTHSAQRIIDQQVENNKFLADAKVKAELESSAKTEFLANVSHELRTPLHAIIGFSEVILTEAYGRLQPPQYLEYIYDINSSGKHLLSLINDILDFSKISADKLKLELIEIDATKIAQASLRFVRQRAEESKIRLIDKLPKEHLVIKADPRRFKQALLNLLSNSVKFTPKNGTVTLFMELDQVLKAVIIKVSDTGIGMDDKDLPKALHSFGQIDSKLSRKYHGTGLGLPLTKKLVELMGGKFEIKSRLGKGTEVTLMFDHFEM
ncbi:MAG: HAMP domain-containing sensor histidine kinase [Rickettsiaceae bacterium]|nr:HAMP domain-containing sensor histidine kinase [Rickettsiaceae bacterium]